MTDPIAQLVADLRERGKPTLAWISQWDARSHAFGHGDPVRAAWLWAYHPEAMLALLRMPPDAWTSGAENGRRLQWAFAAMTKAREMPSPNGCGWIVRETAVDRPHGACLTCVEAIRRAVPIPPTLAELLAGAGRR